MVSGNEGEVYIDALDNDDNNDGDGPPRRQRQYKRDELLGLHSQMASLRREDLQLKDQMSWESNQSEKQFTNLTQMMGRLLGQAAPPIRNVETGEVAVGNQEAPAAQNLIVPLAVATLSVLPHTIHTLWIKYEFGIGGRNPAKDFTPT